MPALAIVAAAALLAGCGAAAREPVVGGPCEGCEDVYVGMPAQLAPTSRIAPKAEPGEPMVLEGVVRTIGGKPAAGIVVYAYHTDAHGIYPKAATRHGALRGWAVTDAGGRYRFDTIRPAGYPDTNIEQHVHMHVVEPGRCTYYIDELVFDDDPRWKRSSAQHAPPGRGGSGVTSPKRDAAGVWHVTRDIVLGEKIPGYPAKEAKS